MGRGRPWSPKHKVQCPQCGWKGQRTATQIARECPRCRYWYPRKVEQQGGA
jgi:hypothetical protein